MISRTSWKLKPFILVLTETWLDDSCPPGFLNFNGYHHVRKDRSHEIKQKYGKSSGGGVAIIYPSNLKVQTRNEFNNSSDETLWVSFVINRNKILLGALYRPNYLDLTNGESNLESRVRCSKTAHFFIFFFFFKFKVTL